MNQDVNFPEMIIEKSNGVSDSERYLIHKCNNTFFSLWSYPNLHTVEKNSKELCDVLAVFGNHIFIFSDKNITFSENVDVEIAWNRWYRHAIDDAARQIIGAERYILENRPLFIDAKLTKAFPLDIPVDENTVIHRIIVARGIRKACKRHFGGGSGSLIVNTAIAGEQHYCHVSKTGQPIKHKQDQPIFTVGLITDRKKYFHVFDDFTLDCIMDELDTVSDFIAYLDCKEELINSGKNILATGEEDILARYLSCMENDKHCIVDQQELHSSDFFTFDDLWKTYVQNTQYLIKKQENEKSYLWDELINKTIDNMMKGTLKQMSHKDYKHQSELFYRFVLPTRVERRLISEEFVESWMQAQKEMNSKSITPFMYIRRINLSSAPDTPDTMLTILWLHYAQNTTLDEHLEIRKQLLNMKLLSYIEKVPRIRYHIGIAKTIEMDMEQSEDFIYADAKDFPTGCKEINDAKMFLEEFLPKSKYKAKEVIGDEYSAEVKTKELPVNGEDWPKA